MTSTLSRLIELFLIYVRYLQSLSLQCSLEEAGDPGVGPAGRGDLGGAPQPAGRGRWCPSCPTSCLGVE